MSADLAPLVREPDPAEEADREEAERPAPGSPASRFPSLRRAHRAPGDEQAPPVSVPPTMEEALALGAWQKRACAGALQPETGPDGALTGYRCARCGATAPPDTEDDPS